VSLLFIHNRFFSRIQGLLSLSSQHLNRLQCHLLQSVGKISQRYHIKLGRYKANQGNAMTNPMAMPSQTKKGSPALYISPIVVSGGATPFITKSTKPKGGVVVAISAHVYQHYGTKPEWVETQAFDYWHINGQGDHHDGQWFHENAHKKKNNLHKDQNEHWG